MKYLILAYGAQGDYDSLGPDEESVELDQFLTRFTEELVASGELVDTQGLTAPALARRVQLRDGVSVITDGPFPETEEVVAGYWLVDCSGFDRATEIAARINQAPGKPADSGVVIRPVMESFDSANEL